MRTGSGKRSILGVICTLFVLGSLLSVAEAQAVPTVERDGDNVSAIRNLEIGNIVYDVEFLNYTAAGIYFDPPVFDFESFGEASVAVTAVNAVLNAEGGIRVLGRGADSGLPYFRVGYGHTLIEIDIDREFGPIDIDIHRDIRLIFISEGTTEDPDAGSTT